MPEEGEAGSGITAVHREVVRLRRAVLKLGHAQELFQGRVEEAVDRLARHAREAEDGPADGNGLDAVQLRVLVELDQAVLHLLEMARESEAAGAEFVRADGEDAPGSLREGLMLLQVRVRNLQRSFGLEPIPARGRPFDDRLHEACDVCDRPDLADGIVAEEVLPGYRLRGRLVRPALVIVNRRFESDFLNKRELP